MGKHKRIGCCGGHGPHCVCESEKQGIITKDEAELIQLVNAIMAQGKRTSEKEETLYKDLMADADLANL